MSVKMTILEADPIVNRYSAVVLLKTTTGTKTGGKLYCHAKNIGDAKTSLLCMARCTFSHLPNVKNISVTNPQKEEEPENEEPETLDF